MCQIELWGHAWMKAHGRALIRKYWIMRCFSRSSVEGLCCPAHQPLHPFPIQQHCCFLGGFLIFIFSIFVFYKNIFSIWKFTEIYPGRLAAGRPGPGRPAAGRQGLFSKKNTKNNCRQVPGTGRPAAGRPAPTGRPATGRPALPPLYKGWLVPPPLTCITKIPETKKKEREGERRSPA